MMMSARTAARIFRPVFFFSLVPSAMPSCARYLAASLSRSAISASTSSSSSCVAMSFSYFRGWSFRASASPILASWSCSFLLFLPKNFWSFMTSFSSFSRSLRSFLSVTTRTGGSFEATGSMTCVASNSEASNSASRSRALRWTASAAISCERATSSPLAAFFSSLRRS